MSDVNTPFAWLLTTRPRHPRRALAPELLRPWPHRRLGRPPTGGGPPASASAGLPIAPLAVPLAVPPHLLLPPTYLPPGVLSNVQPMGPAYLPPAPVSARCDCCLLLGSRQAQRAADCTSPTTQPQSLACAVPLAQQPCSCSPRLLSCSTVPCEVPVIAVPVAAPTGALLPLVPAEPSLPADSDHSSGSPATDQDGTAAEQATIDRSGSRRRLFTGSRAAAAAASAAAASRRPTPTVVAASEGTEVRGSRPGSGTKRPARGASEESTQRKRDAAVMEEEAAEGGCGEGPAGEHLTLEFLEENRYFDMPIQVRSACCSQAVGL